MMMRKAVLSVLVAAASLGAVALPSVSEAHGDIRISVAPPPLRYEVIPQPRYGHVWTPGYWDYRQHHRSGYRHVWVNGYWVAERPGYYYRPHRWIQRDGYWHHERSRWDWDGDGVSNRYDRYPNNPYRR
jgi:hypothetical protein